MKIKAEHRPDVRRPHAGEVWSPLTTNRRSIGFGLLMCGAVVTLLWIWWSGKIKSADQQLSEAYAQQRTFELRIPGAVHGPMRQKRSGQQLSRLDEPPELLLAQARIAQDLKRTPDSPSLLKLKARADLLNWDYQDAMKTLKYVLEDVPDSSEMQLDLATAYFQRAEINDQPSDYGQAIELLGSILEKQPDDKTALFNRSIIFEKLLLYRQATQDSDDYLRLDPNSPWAAELRERRELIAKKISGQGRSGDEIRITPKDYLKRISVGSGVVSDSAYDDQIYLDSAFLDWLPAAYPVQLANGAEEQSQALEALVSLAGALKSLHHDEMLTDLLAHSSAPEFPVAVHKLREALQREQQGNPEGAADSAGEASRFFERGENSAGMLRAQVELVYSQHLLLASDPCRRSAAQLKNRARQRLYEWIVIQSMLEEAACTDTLGDPGGATQLVNDSINAAKRANYWTLYLRATAAQEWLLSDSGDTSAAWRVTHLGLRRYWTDVFPPMRAYSLYYQAGYIAESLHQWHLFYALAQESLDTIAGTKDFELEAIARRRLAMAAAQSGHIGVARNELLRSTALVRAAPRSAITEETATENASEMVRLEAQNNLEHARQLLNEISASNSAFQNRTVSLSFFEAAAEVALLEGKLDEAHRESVASVTIAERIAGTLGTAQQKIGWVEQTRDAYLGFVRTSMAQHNGNLALAVWERYRSIPFLRKPPPPLIEVATSRYREFDSVPPSRIDTEATVNFLPSEGNIVLSYARFSDGIQIWALDHSGVSGAWVSVSADTVQRVATRFIRECSDPTSSRKALDRDARQLYLWLITPQESRIRNASVLTIEPDVPFEGVPFSALVGSDGRYVGENHSIVVSLDTALHNASSLKNRITRNSSAFVIGAPASFEPGLAPLPDAESEAATVARQFRLVVLATGANATRAVLDRSLPHAEVFHFAGHSVIKNGETGLLLSVGVGIEDGFLTANDVSHMALRHCYLAVLSACSTARQEDAMPLNRHGLVSSFLYAGVPHVIASEWDVDSATTAALMKDFYPCLLAGMTSAQALQKVASAIRENPSTSHPYYWAAFQAFGKS